MACPRFSGKGHAKEKADGHEGELERRSIGQAITPATSKFDLHSVHLRVGDSLAPRRPGESYGMGSASVPALCSKAGAAGRSLG